MSRRCHGRVAACAAVLALGIAATASAAPRAPITGRLDRPGYTVIALGYGGGTVSSRAQAFRIVPREARVTLQLRDRHGKYAGPVVVATARGRVVLGVRAGAHLGTVHVVEARGFAVAGRVGAAGVDRSRTAIARAGAPLGNGRNFGLVRSTARGTAGSGRDADLDGVPDAFDIDANGNMVLNALDRTATIRTAAAAAPPNPLQNFSQLFLTVDTTVNADAAAVTTADIDRAMTESLSVVFLNVPGDTRLDCGRLAYCSAGGTGVVESEVAGPVPSLDPFPACCSPDESGAGLMRTNSRGEFRLRPHAASAQIGSGDSVLLRQGSGASLTETPETIQFVFTTVPAVSTWRDGAGNTGTITYPASASTPGAPGNPILLQADASGDYVATFTLWRPQRMGIAGAGEAGLIDIGGLVYEANVPNVPRSPSAAPGSGTGPQCPAASLSTADPNLTVTSAGPGGRFIDAAADAAASPANTLTLTVNLSRCAALRGGSLAPGDTLNMDIAANAPEPAHDHANQIVWVRMR